MHEMSIAMNIVDIVEEELEKAHATVVSQIELEIGTLSGVVLEALEFALDEAVKKTPLENAEIKIEKVSGRASCKHCGYVFESEDYFSSCPQCKSMETEIIQGKELRIKSLLVE